MTKYRFVATCLCALSLAATAAAQPGQADPAVSRTHDDPALQWGACPEFMPEGCAIAVLHGDPASANADVFFKVPAGAEIPRHWHSSAERMVLVSGDLQVTYDDQDPVALQPGAYAYGPARLPHEARCRGAAPCVL
ncbi:MAG: cupin domain-containing protein, partial [Pseudomonadota bacterium]|nr:cupin domain-containing protein [Pseudomonadota bacterium]